MKALLVFLILTIAVTEAFAQERAAAVEVAVWRWADGSPKQVPVCWERSGTNNGASFVAERNMVRKAVEATWEKEADIDFTCWCDCAKDSKGLRILIKDDKNDGPRTLKLGRELDGIENGMLLNFTFNNWSPAMRGRLIDYQRAIAIHEFGHALGFAHEQNRIECKFPNCSENKRQGVNGDYFITPCDSKSVMNYCNPEYSNWGKLSDLDKFAIVALYGRPPDRALSITEEPSIVYSVAEAIRHKYRIKAFIAGDEDANSQIKSVTYLLHYTFWPKKSEEYRNRQPKPVLVDKRDNKFALSLSKVWGEFILNAVVEYFDGNQKELTVYLKLPGNNQK